jgi:ubiquitin C-terminal hydrolase
LQKIRDSKKRSKKKSKKLFLKISILVTMVTALPLIILATFVNETGMYELFAVLTHKGRMADSGHYVAWVKEDTGNYGNLSGVILV